MDWIWELSHSQNKAMSQRLGKRNRKIDKEAEALNRD